MKISCATSFMTKKFGMKEGLKLLHDGGFDGYDYGWYGDGLTLEGEKFDKYFTDLKNYLDSIGAFVGQLHSPTPSYCGDPEKDAKYFDLQERAIKACALLGCKYIVIHPAIPLVYRYTCYREETKKINMEFYGRLMPTLEKYGVTVCLENMFNADPKRKYCICPTVMSTSWEMKDYYNSLACPNNVAYCLDIGHGNLTGDSPQHMIYDLGDHLACLHVHDNDGMHDNHTIPCHGNIDWTAVMHALRDVRYNGVFNFEADGYYSTYAKMIDGTDRTVALAAANMLSSMGHYLTEVLMK